jgi:CBS domain-containing protein
VRHIASGVVSKPISSYMTKSPITIGRSASLAKAHALMREHDIRHLPVMQSGHVVGVVSLGGLHLLETIANFPLEAVDVDEAMTASPEIVFASTRQRDVPADPADESIVTGRTRETRKHAAR